MNIDYNSEMQYFGMKLAKINRGAFFDFLKN